MNIFSKSYHDIYAANARIKKIRDEIVLVLMGIIFICEFVAVKNRRLADFLLFINICDEVGIQCSCNCRYILEIIDKKGCVSC